MSNNNNNNNENNNNTSPLEPIYQLLASGRVDSVLKKYPELAEQLNLLTDERPTIKVAELRTILNNIRFIGNRIIKQREVEQRLREQQRQ